jgi:hypothetical protein
MSWLSDDERALLARVIEIPPDLNRRNVPGLKPLSLYSSELKNLKQVASVLALAAAGQPLSDNAPAGSFSVSVIYFFWPTVLEYFKRVSGILFFREEWAWMTRFTKS